MTDNSTQSGDIRVGMDVVDVNSNSIGTVKDLADDGFVVNRRFKPDITLPYRAIMNVSGGQVVLDVPKAQMGDLE